MKGFEWEDKYLMFDEEYAKSSDKEYIIKAREKI